MLKALGNWRTRTSIMCNLAPNDFACRIEDPMLPDIFFLRETGTWNFYVKNFFLNTGNKFDILENTVLAKQNICAGWI